MSHEAAREGAFDAVLRQLRVPSEEIQRCDPNRTLSVNASLKRDFVRDGSRTWRLGLKTPPEVHEYPRGDAHKHLMKHVPGRVARCWFIIETEQPVLPVYDALVARLSEALTVCTTFDSYLADKAGEWLLVENGHKAILLARRAALVPPRGP